MGQIVLGSFSSCFLFGGVHYVVYETTNSLKHHRKGPLNVLNQSANGEFFMNVMPMGNFYHGKLSSTTTTNYSVPLKLIPYPLTVNTNHSHNISSTIVWNTLTMNFTDKSEIQGVSSGTVTMPDGKSYANALLVN